MANDPAYHARGDRRVVRHDAAHSIAQSPDDDGRSYIRWNRHPRRLTSSFLVWARQIVMRERWSSQTGSDLSRANASGILHLAKDPSLIARRPLRSPSKPHRLFREVSSLMPEYQLNGDVTPHLHTTNVGLSDCRAIHSPLIAAGIPCRSPAVCHSVTP